MEDYSTKYFIDRYCCGNGIEVGLEEKPYSLLGETVYVHRFAKYNGGNRFISAEANRLPFANSNFDFVLSSHCLEHCPDTIRTLTNGLMMREMTMVL